MKEALITMIVPFALMGGILWSIFMGLIYL
jgi:riboflavin transporter FmnP